MPSQPSLQASAKRMSPSPSKTSLDDYQETAPVGSFAPNRFGLYDMVGNVWAWTEDCYRRGNSGYPTDGSPWTGGAARYCPAGRAVRGGSWYDVPQLLRSAVRDGDSPDLQCVIVGFRVGRTLTP
jgi:formylglycine-generating enzyme required for sulfatase activity